MVQLSFSLQAFAPDLTYLKLNFNCLFLLVKSICWGLYFLILRSAIVNGLYYRPQTKLREGNVFTGICLSTGEGRGASTGMMQHSLLKPHEACCSTWGMHPQGAHPQRFGSASTGGFIHGGVHPSGLHLRYHPIP